VGADLGEIRLRYGLKWLDPAGDVERQVLVVEDKVGVRGERFP
jgi:hypothetical protein